MPEKKDRQKKQEAEHTNQRKPEREDLEAELPQAPAREPLIESLAIGGMRGPHPVVEAEVE